MIDLLPGPPPIIKEFTQPIADRLGLHTLPLHVHEVLLAAVFYFALDIYVSPAVSSWALPQIYSQLPRRTARNWDVHFVSQVQSLIICSLALWIILTDQERATGDAEGRILGYNGAAGMTQAFAAGYFVWDAITSIIWVKMLGLSSLIHAISALAIITLGFRPFANYYGVAFVLYELSTPFLNVHWFLDKCHMTGSRLQLYNGITLIVVFLGCRLVLGSYLSVQIYQDMWLLHKSPYGLVGQKQSHSSGPATASQRWLSSSLASGHEKLPMWTVLVYLGGNTILCALNFYWFSQMIQAVRKRFPKNKKS